MVDMTPVSSSNVSAVGYDEDTKDVYVDFLNGSTYKYKGVPEAVFKNLLSAHSVGGYLNSNIKNIYPYEKVA